MIREEVVIKLLQNLIMFSSFTEEKCLKQNVTDVFLPFL